MPERLTPEQLDRFADELEVAYPDRAAIRVLRQAARDARTLQRVQAWTESASAIHDAVLSPAQAVNIDVGARIAKAEVAALLRAEEDQTPMRRISAQIKEG